MNITEKRINKMLSLLKGSIVAETYKADEILYKECGYKTGSEMPSSEGFLPFEEGMRWGCVPDSHCWFYIKGSLPKRYSFCKLRLHIDTTPDNSNDGWNVYNPQFIAYENGKALQGLDTNHHYIEFDYKENYSLYLYGYTGSMGKNLDLRIYFEIIDSAAEKLYYDAYMLFESALILGEETKEYADIVSCLCGMFNIIDFRDTHSPVFRSSVEEAEEYITAFYNGRCRNDNRKVVCMGHTHIDVAWLWTLDQTKEKAQHTFSTVLALMDKFPSLIFMSSQPQLLKYVKEEDGELYERIKQKVKEGRFEVEGGMWVEADCNLTSGESLIRQIIHGKRFFKSEFGAESHILWLPDVFGYSASLPQICKKSGIDTFVTSKISWNDTNRMPHDVFKWIGIDGSEIFTYFLTPQEKSRDSESANYTTYVATSDPKYLAGCFERFSDKSLTDTVLLTMGYGDGGGGPTNEMCEKVLRAEKGIPGIPAGVFGGLNEFIEKIKVCCIGSGRLPTWEGELYLEYHRGTYTSAAENKRLNRLSEFALANGEMYSLISNIKTGRNYNSQLFYGNWETVLLNQFHDIIPGSSIREVYETSRKQYASLLDSTEKETASCLESLTKSGNGITVFNPTFVSEGLAKKDGEYCYFTSLPSCGYKTLKPLNTNNIKIGENSLESNYYIIGFNENGYISSLYDKTAKREICTGVLGGLVAYEDLPFNYDCWNIEAYHEEKPYKVEGLISLKSIQRGNGAGFEIRRRFMESEIVQEIIIFQSSRRIDFVTYADWKQKNILLKAEFDADINNTDGIFDIQYGFVRREANRNTSWDSAKFEVCGQKYADISDGGYGIAVINDCKYGHSVKRGKLTLSLIKSSGYPNRFVDTAEHRFTYSLIPHCGDFRESGIIDEAVLLNNPPRIEESRVSEEFSLVSCNERGISIGCAKQGYDGTSRVFRFAESFDRHITADFDFGFKFEKAYICDMLENEISEIEATHGNTVTLDFKPFEIITIKLK